MGKDGKTYSEKAGKLSERWNRRQGPVLEKELDYNIKKGLTMFVIMTNCYKCVIGEWWVDFV